MALSLAARENKSLTRLDLDKPPRDSTLPPELIVSRKFRLEMPGLGIMIHKL